LFSSTRRRFWLKKLHSLSGVVPLGVFLVHHLWTSGRALAGQAEFDEAVRDLQRTPYLAVLEMTLVILPLTFHGLYGVLLSLEGRANVGAYPFNRNWMYVAQRLTGLLALVFVVWHLGDFWFARWTGRLSARDFYPVLCERLSTTSHGVPLIALAYILGIAATVFHFANGLWGFCTSWGITPSRRSQRISATVFGLAGVAMFLLGANTAIYFATGSRLAFFGVPKSARIESWTAGTGRPGELVSTCPDASPATND
jgi:succinate dehydrogenase/fumarate reductase cytochrome b subunit (b558 family)